MLQMGSKIVSWNLRGLNAYDKQIAVRDLILSHRCLACGIQETKLASMTRWFVRQLWYDDDFEWELLPSQG